MDAPHDSVSCDLPRAGWLAALLVVAVATIAGGQPEGRQRSAASSPRVVSLVPAVTEMLFAMGAGPVVVGVSSFDRFPPETRTRPSVGALLDPDFERIASLRPNLVVAYGSQTDLLARLAETGIGAYVYRHAALGDITQTVRDVGRRVGAERAATDLANQIDRDLDAVRKSVTGRTRPRTLLVFDREPGALRGMFASGGVGFLHELLELAGARNVFADVARENLQLSSEQLIARAPEVILDLWSSAGWQPERLPVELAAWRRLVSLPAVRSGRVHVLVDDSLTIPGPRVVLAARTFAEAVHRGSTR